MTQSQIAKNLFAIEKSFMFMCVSRVSNSLLFPHTQSPQIVLTKFFRNHKIFLLLNNYRILLFYASQQLQQNNKRKNTTFFVFDLLQQIFLTYFFSYFAATKKY